MQFEQLLEVFSIPLSRPLPLKVEITVLSDKASTYGLLLESPEPLDWERVSLSAFYAGLQQQLDIHDEVIRLSAASIRPASDPNQQYVDVFCRDRTDISGYTLEYRALSAAEDDPYSQLYTFAENSSFDPGTLVRVHLGEAPTPGEGTEHVYLYAGPVDAPFSHQGEVIRLLDNAGKVVHSRIFLGQGSYSELKINRVRNADNTRVFIFSQGITSWTELARGFYKLTFTYQRDIGENAPLLMRYGFSQAEEVSLDFSLPALLPDV